MNGNSNPDARPWGEDFKSRARASRIPISATLELTRNCNLSCRHCYLGDLTDASRRSAKERDTAAVKASLREWTDAGSLYLLITGGDPMMRPDFVEIYRCSRELGLLVTVFCNGTLVSPSVLRAFRDLPPRKVEISLYGATPETHDRITRVPGSHKLAWNGIRRLVDNGTRVMLKTILMTLNRHEIDAMERQASDIGLPFRFDASIVPCLPGATGRALSFRVDPADVVALDLTRRERRERWLKSIEAASHRPAGDQVYNCGAGITSFCADPFGNLAPCPIATHYATSQGERSFDVVWRDDLARIRQRRRTRADGCLCGHLRGASAHCPAVNYLENGDEEIDSDYMRATANLRFRALKPVLDEHCSERSATQ